MLIRLNRSLGWHWLFWFLNILTAPVLVAILLFLPETLRSIVGNGSIRTSGWNTPLWDHFMRLLHKDPNKESASALQPTHSTPEHHLRDAHPLKPLLMLKEKDVALMLFYNGLIYTLCM